MHRHVTTVLTGLVLTAVLVGSSGCPTNAAADGNAAGDGQALTLGHAGVDFSAGIAGDPNTGDVANSDGDIITWAPAPNNWVNSDTEVWFRPAANDSNNNYIADMGAVTLGSVTSVPLTWDGGPGADLPALQVGHVYVVQCLDGYAKFLVNATRTDPQWEADVHYVFSSGTTFAE